MYTLTPRAELIESDPPLPQPLSDSGNPVYLEREVVTAMYVDKRGREEIQRYERYVEIPSE